MKKLALAALAAVGSLASAGQAVAAAGPTSCQEHGVATLSDLAVVGGTVVGVCGFFNKNETGDSKYVDFALDKLGLDYDGSPLAHVDTKYNVDGQDFLDILGIDALYGDIFVAFHTGNGASWGNNTAFFHIVAGPDGVTSIVPNTSGKGLSNGTLFAANLTKPVTVPVSSAVPEPATWVTMALGFGLIGYGIRRRRKRTVLA